MTNSVNISRSIEVTEPPDYLSGAVLQSLMRTYSYLSWGVVKTFVVGGITFGVAPLIFLPRKFRQHAAIERDQLWHLAQWLRVRCGGGADKIARRVVDLDQSNHAFAMLSRVSMIVAIACALRLIHLPELSLSSMTSAAFSAKWVREILETGSYQSAAILWTLFIGLGYVFHWLGVQVHASRVRRVFVAVNEFARSEGFAALPAMRSSLGIRPVWIVGGIVLASLGAVWGLPMMLAGAAHRRYIRHAGGELRQSLAERVRTILTAQRPLSRIRVPEMLRLRCLNDQCRSALPVIAGFCPRCGSRATQRVDRVA